MEFALALILKVMTYAGVIAVAGSALHRYPARAFAVQAWAGAALLWFAEPVRSWQFLSMLSGGDWSGWGFDLIWAELTGFGIGQSSLLRLLLAPIIALCLMLTRLHVIAVGAAFLLLATFLLEGHTVTAELEGWNGWLAKAVLLMHMALVSWWLAVLLPLLWLIRRSEGADLARSFGQQALFAVPVLLVAGALLFGLLTGWTIDLSQPYQRAFLFKIIGVASLLTLGAYHKLRLVRRYEIEQPSAQEHFVRSLSLEIGIALSVLLATAVAITVGLEM